MRGEAQRIRVPLAHGIARDPLSDISASSVRVRPLDKEL